MREDLPELLSPERAGPGAIRAGAEQVLAALAARGALFFGELKAATQMLPGHLEEALRELGALGLVTSDAFAAVRKIVEGDKSTGPRRRGRLSLHGVAAPIGRWSLFPGSVPPPTREAYLEAWCRVLLRRWGVVFRDLLARESSAPSWQDLVGTLRRMELRGDVRGGRFVAQVAGEQYAWPSCIESLREARQQIESQADSDWLVLSAADPVNLFGVVTPPPRIAATHRNALVMQSGRLVASRASGRVEFYEPIDQATQWEMRRAMTLGQRPAREQPTAAQRRVPSAGR